MRRRKNSAQKTSLYTRILFRLTIPLFFLAAVVTAIQLTNQIQSMNRYYQIESRLTFDSVQRILEKTLRESHAIFEPDIIKHSIKKVIPANKNISFQIYDMFKQSPLLFEKEPWTEIDNHSAERSIYERKEDNKNYLVRVDKVGKKLIAYIPHDMPESNQLFVARVIYPLAHLGDALGNSRGMLITMIFFILLVGAFIGRGLAKSIVNPIRTMSTATQAIMQGQLGVKVNIKTGDELESLAEAFNHMSASLKLMRASAEDANPLTQLPGNRGIESELQKRIHEKQKFVLFHTDLDRFKTFNDLYGLAKGDLAIIKTAGLLRETIQQQGSENDFVGHQGGDDFVVIVQPNHAKEIAESIIDRFDNELVKSLYSKEDFERGYTEALDRRAMAESGAKDAVKIKFPLMALSLAGVSNVKRDFAGYEDCLKATVKIKKEVKAKVESCYLIEE